MATEGTSKNGLKRHLRPYKAPVWAQGLSWVPQSKVEIAMHNTPIQEWPLPDVPSDVHVYIKKEDMTGFTVSGNKVRTLEFILADAIEKGYTHIITWGRVTSNHCRAVAVASRIVGLQPHVVLECNLKDPEELGVGGNVLLDRLTGADIHLVPMNTAGDLYRTPENLISHIGKSTGEKLYTVPLGGASMAGLYGYIDFFRELIEQNVPERFDDLVFPCGSGTMLAGLFAAVHLTESNIRLHPVLVAGNKDLQLARMKHLLEDIGLDTAKPETTVDFITGYMGKGYGITSDEDIELLVEISSTTGVCLDPVYGIKPTKALIKELNINRERFKGDRILYVHTGGTFNLFDGRMDAYVKRSGSVTNKVKVWTDMQNGQ